VKDEYEFTAAAAVIIFCLNIGALMKLSIFFLFLFISIVVLSNIAWCAEEDQRAEWEIKCEELKNIPIPALDRPKKEELESVTNCDPEDLYYGIGIAADYQKARFCAYKNYPKDDSAFGGTAILMLLYANGFGVKRNIELAKRFVCEVGGAPMEIEGRLEHLDRIKEPSIPGNKSFDVCDDISSGLMMGYCVQHAEKMAQMDRASKFKTIMASWTEAEKTAFKKLQAASERFTKDRAEKEIDSRGTAGAAEEIGEKTIQRRDFLESVEKLEKNQAPKYTSAQNKEEDKKLNSLYQAIQKLKLDEILAGNITLEGVKTTQRAWLSYRDAWVEFAKLKYPKYSSESIAAWFTKKRNHMLKNLHGYLK
jgi:uncharacterized protein YecT (DUF1311 family)